MKTQVEKFHCPICKKNRDVAALVKDDPTWGADVCIHCSQGWTRHPRAKKPILRGSPLSYLSKKDPKAKRVHLAKFTKKLERQRGKCADCKKVLRKAHIVGINTIRKLVCTECSRRLRNYIMSKRERPFLSLRAKALAMLLVPVDLTEEGEKW